MLSENIKVSEVSDILRKQLEGIDTRVQLVVMIVNKIQSGILLSVAPR